jgi:hypothetical protein
MRYLLLRIEANENNYENKKLYESQYTREIKRQTLLVGGIMGLTADFKL